MPTNGIPRFGALDRQRQHEQAWERRQRRTLEAEADDLIADTSRRTLREIAEAVVADTRQGRGVRCADEHEETP